MPIRGPRDVPDRISVTKAGKRLADVVLAVQQGREITLTRYRRPVAKVVAHEETQ